MSNKKAYIVAGYRTAVGKAERKFKIYRPDVMAGKTIRKLMADLPAR